MKEFLEYLPGAIDTPILILIPILIWRGYVVIKAMIKDNNEDRKRIEHTIAERISRETKIEFRLTEAESEIETLKQAFKVKSDEVREDVKILSAKIDRILEILIKFKQK